MDSYHCQLLYYCIHSGWKRTVINEYFPLLINLLIIVLISEEIKNLTKMFEIEHVTKSQITNFLNCNTKKIFRKLLNVLHLGSKIKMII